MVSLVSTRLPQDMDLEIEWYAKKEKLGKTVALRKILERGLNEVRLEYALEQYRKGKVTLWKAAEIARMSLWEMMDIVKKKEIPMLYSLEDVEEDLRAVFE